MSSSSTPRWLHILRDSIAIENISLVVYSLATVDQSSPRVRTVVHRGILTPTPSRPLLFTTTDIRSPKAHQLHANPASEAVFWFPKSNSQIRIVAHTYALPSSSHPWHDAFPAQHLSSPGSPAIDYWEEHRLQAFNAISPALRASFVRPLPGSSLAELEATAETWPKTAPKPDEAKTAEEKTLIKEALENFALVVVDPVEVDYVELAVIPNRRTAWKRVGMGKWEERAIVP